MSDHKTVESDDGQCGASVQVKNIAKYSISVVHKREGCEN